eukprot:6213092-Pleurochrysis_carterae.AAC.1
MAAPRVPCGALPSVGALHSRAATGDYPHRAGTSWLCPFSPARAGVFNHRPPVARRAAGALARAGERSCHSRCRRLPGPPSQGGGKRHRRGRGLPPPTTFPHS